MLHGPGMAPRASRTVLQLGCGLYSSGPTPSSDSSQSHHWPTLFTHRTLWRWRPALWRAWATVRLLPPAALGWLCAVLAVVTLLLCMVYGMRRRPSSLLRQLSHPLLPESRVCTTLALV